VAASFQPAPGLRGSPEGTLPSDSVPKTLIPLIDDADLQELPIYRRRP